VEDQLYPKFRPFLEMNELVNEMVAAVDDGDGEIDYDEFVKMIQKY
jgi:Ca2+-binding EF-hand superfamily protein